MCAIIISHNVCVDFAADDRLHDNNSSARTVVHSELMLCQVLLFTSWFGDASARDGDKNVVG